MLTVNLVGWTGATLLIGSDESLTYNYQLRCDPRRDCDEDPRRMLLQQVTEILSLVYSTGMASGEGVA